MVRAIILLGSKSMSSPGIGAVKCMSAVVLLVLGGSGAMLPLKWKRLSDSATAVGLISAMAAGVFMCLGIVHILPEAAEMLAPVGAKSIDEFVGAYRVPFALCVATYILLLAFEHAMETCTFLQAEPQSSPPTEMSSPTKKPTTQDANQTIPAVASTCEHVCVPVADGGDQCTCQTERLQEEPAVPTQKQEQSAKELSVAQLNVESESDASSRKIVVLTMLVALSLHGFVEGLALGVMRSAANALVLFFAIAGHKWAEALALGVRLSQQTSSKEPQPYWPLCAAAVYAATSPLGVFVGWAAATNSSCFSGCIMACAAGSFIFVGATEIAAEELRLARASWPKLFAFGVGALLVYAVTVVEG